MLSELLGTLYNEICFSRRITFILRCVCVSAYARAYGQHKINIYLSCIIVCFSWKSTILLLSSNDQFVFEQLSNSTFFN